MVFFLQHCTHASYNIYTKVFSSHALVSVFVMVCMFDVIDSTTAVKGLFACVFQKVYHVMRKSLTFSYVKLIHNYESID